MEYNLFVPPESISQKDSKLWSVKEAKIYFNWLMSSIEPRLSALGGYLDIEIQKTEDSLSLVAEKAADILPTTIFSESGELTNTGFALAADIGILMGQCWLESFPERLGWEILRQKRIDLSYNRPVIQGFSSGLYVDPIHVSINQARRVIAKTHDYKTFLQVYNYWYERAS